MLRYIKKNIKEACRNQDDLYYIISDMKMVNQVELERDNF